MTPTLFTLVWYDYIIFILILVCSFLIGIYFAFNAQKNTKEYLHGGKNLKVFPVTISLISSYMTSSILLGLPVEIYYYGATIWLILPSLILLCIVTIYAFLPVFFNLQVATTFEYLEKRFDRKSRQFASAIYLFVCVFVLASAIYAPALALSAVTGFKLHYVVVLVSTVCIFYTSIGGLKTVIWTDVLQFSVVSATFLVILVLGILSLDSFSEIWTKNVKTGRLDIFQFDPDPTRRDSFWIIIIGLTVTFISIISMDQSFMQKFLAVSTLHKLKLSVVFLCIGLFLGNAVLILIGMVLYARYSNCDPYSAGFIEKPDQLLPYFVTEIAREIPGVLGIFTASIFCSSLSLQSALLNCLAGSVYSDFFSKISENYASLTLKLLVVAIGVVCTTLIFVVQYLGTLYPFLIALSGITCGPLLGMFSSGLFFRNINTKGAFYGTLIGVLSCCCIALPASYFEYQGLLEYPTKEISVVGCSFINQTVQNLVNSENINSTNLYKPPNIFKISFYYYPVIGAGTTILTALIISYITKENSFSVDEKLLSPVICSKKYKTEYLGIEKANQNLESHAV